MVIEARRGGGKLYFETVLPISRAEVFPFFAEARNFIEKNIAVPMHGNGGAGQHRDKQPDNNDQEPGHEIVVTGVAHGGDDNRAQEHDDQKPGPADTEGMPEIVAHAADGVPQAGSDRKLAGHVFSPWITITSDRAGPA